MPNLPDQTVAAKAPDGVGFEERVACNVSSEGEFSVAIPEALTEVALSLKDMTKTGARIAYWRAGKQRVYAKTLKAALDFLKECAVAFVNVETTTTRVIIYGTVTDVSFWITKAGKIYPNGASHGEGGNWWKDRHGDRTLSFGNHPNFFQVGLAAAVYDKVTRKRATGDTIEWLRVRDEDDPAITRLNSFCGISVDPEIRHMEEMPYTPEAAEFFANIMLGLCAMAKKIDDFFADRKGLMLAIRKGAKLLEGPK